MTKIEWVRGDDGSPGISWNCLRAEREIERRGQTITVSANHCEHVNEACRWCYAEKGNARQGGLPFKRQNRDAYRFVIDEEKLLAPLKRRKPTRYFVESVSDVFGEWWAWAHVIKIYAVMALTPHHTYVNLSKRPERRREFLDDPRSWDHIDKEMNALAPEHWCTRELQDFSAPPLRNVIEGTSVSCQEEADEFIPILLRTKAAVRGVSCEPLLGPIDLTRSVLLAGRDRAAPWHVDWVIVGGESGPNARPMHPDWARSLRDQCQAAGVSFFFKQWGEWQPRQWCKDGGTHALRTSGQLSFQEIQSRPNSIERVGADADWQALARVGKKSAGRLLDGVEHNGMPEVRA